VETLKAALFARMAKPDIRRRFSDPDPVERQVAEIIERATIYCDDAYDAETAYGAAIDDYLLPGRGIVKVCYEARVVKDDDGTEDVIRQQVYEEHVNWDEFRHDPARQWKKVSWIAFRHLMNRDATRKNFKNLGQDTERVPLNWSPHAGQGQCARRLQAGRGGRFGTRRDSLPLSSMVTPTGTSRSTKSHSDGNERIKRLYVHHLRHKLGLGDVAVDQFSTAIHRAATKIEVGRTGHFEPSGLSKDHWKGTGPIPTVFRVGMPYLNPHSVRNTLSRSAASAI
jgi:hypothetical protein